MPPSSFDELFALLASSGVASVAAAGRDNVHKVGLSAGVLNPGAPLWAGALALLAPMLLADAWHRNSPRNVSAACPARACPPLPCAGRLAMGRWAGGF